MFLPTQARTVIDLTDDGAAILSALDNIQRERGNTAIGSAIVRGQELLRNGGADERARVMFLLTDGANLVCHAKFSVLLVSDKYNMARAGTMPQEFFCDYHDPGSKLRRVNFVSRFWF